jgi:hypothetical protein
MAAFNAIVDVEEPLVGATEHICGLDLAPYSKLRLGNVNHEVHPEKERRSHAVV